MLKADNPNERAIRVIVAESEDGQRSRFIGELKAHRDLMLFAAADWDELKALLDGDWYDVLVVGADLGGVSGIEINDRVAKRYADAPSTVLVGPASAASVIKALRCGFADYLVAETANGRDLYDAGMRAAQRVAETRNMRARIRSLEKLAQRDTATGLNNRKALDDRLQQLIGASDSREIKFALILVRFRELDEVFTAFGSKVGDQAVHAFATRLKETARASDSFGRLDHDTFFYLIDRDVDDERVDAACRRLAEQTSFYLNLDDVGLAIKADVGASIFPVDGACGDELIDAARDMMKIEDQHVGGVPSQTERALAGSEHPAPRFRVIEDKAPADVVSGNEDADETAAQIEAVTASLEPADENERRVADRRASRRYRTLKAGKLVLQDGMGTINCVIRDMSLDGARVTVDGVFSIPRSLEFMVLESNQRAKAEVRWQKGNELGLQYTDAKIEPKAKRVAS